MTIPFSKNNDVLTKENLHTFQYSNKGFDDIHGGIMGQVR